MLVHLSYSGGAHNHRSTGKGISLTLETQPQPRTPGHLPCQSHPTWSCWWAQHICTHISDEQHQQKKHLTSWISASVWGWPDLKMRKISPRCWGKLRCWAIVVGWLVHSVRQQLSDSLMCQKKKKKSVKKWTKKLIFTTPQHRFLQLICPIRTQVFCLPEVPSVMAGMRKVCRQFLPQAGERHRKLPSSGWHWHKLFIWFYFSSGGETASETMSLEKACFNWYLKQTSFMLPAAMIPDD